MKKLMIALSAVAAAIFAVGTVRGAELEGSVGVDFESYSTGAFAESTLEGGLRYWYSPSNDGNVISNHVGNAGPTGQEGNPKVPDFFANAQGNNEKFLYLDTSAPLFRSVNPNTNDSTVPVAEAAFTGVDIGANGVYLDTLVQFTAADSEFSDDLTGGDKIAIEYVEHESENAPGDYSYTNFVIRAGYLGATVQQKNYKCYLASDPNFETFDKTAWHRLTVRTIADIDGAGHVGFVVYLDEEPIVYDVAELAGANFAATGAAGAFYTSELHALYPSAVQSGTDKTTISAASFSGTGAIDDVVFTDSTPNFISAGELVRAEITLGTGISSVTVTIGETTYNPVDATASPLVFNLPAGTASFNLAVTPDSANGYTFAGIEGAILTEGVVTWSTATPSFTVLATRNSVSYIDSNDELQSCPSLATAFANAKSGTTITLAYDVDVAATEDMTQFRKYILSGKAVTLDLNGKTIDAGTDVREEVLFDVASGATLTIIDSVGGGKIDYDTSYGTVSGDGEIFIGATSGDRGVTFEGTCLPIGDEPLCEIVRGKFKKSSNGSAAFTFEEDYVSGTSEVTDGGDYWSVAPAGEVPEVTFALTLPTVTGASAAVTAGGTPVANIAAIVSNTEVVVTWTATDGYKITAGATETITMDSNKTAASPTVEAITYATLTITQVANCTIVVSNATEEVATGAKFDVDDAVVLTVYRTPAEGYELDNCAASEQITMDQDREVTAAVKQAAAATWTVTLTLGANVSSVSYCLTDDLATTNTLSASGSFTIEQGKSFVFVGVVCAEGYELDVETSMASIQGATIDPTYYTITPSADASGTISAKQKTTGGYPSYIGDDAAKQAKYDVWKAAYGDDTNSQYEEAYLLNCAPADVATEKAAFKFTKIAYENGAWVTETMTKNTDGDDYNGTVTVTRYSDVGCKTESATGTFFKATLE